MTDIVRRTDYPLTPMTEWDPFRAMREFDPFRAMREMLRLDPLRDVVPTLLRSEGQAWMPRFEVRENGNTLRFLADVPGIKKDDLDISVSGNRLIINGHREAEEQIKDEQIYAYERSYGDFTRVFALPESADLDHISSDLRDGVLTIVVPKSGSSMTKKITIGGPSTKS